MRLVSYQLYAFGDDARGCYSRHIPEAPAAAAPPYLSTCGSPPPWHRAVVGAAASLCHSATVVAPITPAVHLEDLDSARNICHTHGGSLRDGPTCARRHREMSFLVRAGGYVALEKRIDCCHDAL